MPPAILNYNPGYMHLYYGCICLASLYFSVFYSAA